MHDSNANESPLTARWSEVKEASCRETTAGAKRIICVLQYARGQRIAPRSKGASRKDREAGRRGATVEARCVVRTPPNKENRTMQRMDNKPASTLNAHGPGMAGSDAVMRSVMACFHAKNLAYSTLGVERFASRTFLLNTRMRI